MMLKHVDFEVAAWGELPTGPVDWLAYASAVMAHEPLAYWREVDASAGVLTDVAGPGPDVAVVGDVDVVSGALTRGASTGWVFTVGVGYGQAASNVIPPASDASYTVALWVRMDSDMWGACVADHGDDWLLLVNPSGHVQVAIGGAMPVVMDSGDLRDGAWHHVAVTRTSEGDMTLWFDGAVGDTGDQPAGTPAGGTGFRLGHPSLGAKVLEDEVAVFGQALSGAAVRGLYDSGRGVLSL